MGNIRNVRQLMDFTIPFEEKGEIGEEDLERTRKKAILYHGVDPDVLEGFLIHAEDLALELQENLQEEIAARSKLFIYQVNSYLPEPLGSQEERAVEQMVRCQLACLPDEERLSEVLFQMAESMGQFFAEYAEEGEKD